MLETPAGMKKNNISFTVGAMIVVGMLSVQSSWAVEGGAGPSKGNIFSRVKKKILSLTKKSPGKKSPAPAQVATDPLAPPTVTVSDLFAVIQIDPEDFEGWTASGLGLGKLGGWAMTPHRQEKLIEIQRADYEVGLSRQNETPVVFNSENEESAEFFNEVNSDTITGDGTWAGYKYVFYPHRVVDADGIVVDATELQVKDEPITLYLMKKIPANYPQEKLNCTNFHFHLADEYYHQALVERAKQNYPEMMSFYEKGAHYQDGQAELALAQVYLDGKLAKKDLYEGMDYLNRAANHGNAEAQYHLALLHFYQRPASAESEAAAVRWFSSASMQGHLRASFYLAEIYEKGTLLPEDLTKAKELYQKVAETSKDGSVLELRAHHRLFEIDENYTSMMFAQVKLISLANGGIAAAQAAVSHLSIAEDITLPGPVIVRFLEAASAAGNHEAMVIQQSREIDL